MVGVGLGVGPGLCGPEPLPGPRDSSHQTEPDGTPATAHPHLRFGPGQWTGWAGVRDQSPEPAASGRRGPGGAARPPDPALELEGGDGEWGGTLALPHGRAEVFFIYVYIFFF